MQSLPNKQNYSTNSHSPIALVMLLVWLTLLGTVFFYRQDLVDWWKLHNYEAPYAVSQIVTQDTMTNFGQKLFYINQPLITPKGSFGEYCPKNGGEQTIVLGCYHSVQNGIYVLQVKDPRLNGVEQVTAAHEMLHAAYDRLSSKERGRVDNMLMDYYTNGLTDARVRTTINAYKHSEPTELVNEMHSIFGTEIGVLPVQLEEYYKQYFNNRSAVVAFASKYQGEFTSRQSVVSQADAKLATLKTQIDLLNSNLASRLSEISSQQSNLKNLRASGDIATYNSRVPGFNSMVDDYNSEVEQLRSLIRNYNQLVNERNAVALEADQLQRELSSEPSTINK